MESEGSANCGFITQVINETCRKQYSNKNIALVSSTFLLTNAIYCTT